MDGWTAPRPTSWTAVAGYLLPVETAHEADSLRHLAIRHSNPGRDLSMSSPNGSPTVVLVHGAFADAIELGRGHRTRLENAGIAVLRPFRTRCVVSPADAAYVASAIDQVPGPVLAVGHSYGGAVITNARAQYENVVGLVYVAAFAPEEGETLLEIEGASRDSVLAPRPPRVETIRPDRAARPRWSSDRRPGPVPRCVRRRSVGWRSPRYWGASQRPVAAAAFGEKSGLAAWKTLPAGRSWQRATKRPAVTSCDRWHSGRTLTITEIDGSHVIMISQPDAVTDVILNALRSVE